jgi:hypothetical protein
MLSSVDCITTTSESKFLVHTRASEAAPPRSTEGAEDAGDQIGHRSRRASIRHRGDAASTNPGKLSYAIANSVSMAVLELLKASRGLEGRVGDRRNNLSAP